jgi:structural maintenance of chromosome 1
MYTAVTLEGTVIHKSGLITGGQGSGSGRKFDDVEIAGEWSDQLNSFQEIVA